MVGLFHLMGLIKCILSIFRKICGNIPVSWRKFSSNGWVLTEERAQWPFTAMSRSGSPPGQYLVDTTGAGDTFAGRSMVWRGAWRSGMRYSARWTGGRLPSPPRVPSLDRAEKLAETTPLNHLLDGRLRGGSRAIWLLVRRGLVRGCCRASRYQFF